MLWVWNICWGKPQAMRRVRQYDLRRARPLLELLQHTGASFMTSRASTLDVKETEWFPWLVWVLLWCCSSFLCFYFPLVKEGFSLCHCIIERPKHTGRTRMHRGMCTSLCRTGSIWTRWAVFARNYTSVLESWKWLFSNPPRATEGRQ